MWSALGSLAGAPAEQRTLTGLSVLLQSNALRQALAPYVLGGAHGNLLDADRDRLGSASVQCFEMEELMSSKAAVLAVLGYLFTRFEERFDGAPTLLILDECWLFLDHPVFAARIRQWLKTLRKKNVSVVFATQSLADIEESKIAPVIVESCPSRVYLPNPQATEPRIRSIYESFGLNSRQIEIIANAEPKRDYYYQSRLGNRVFDMGLGPIVLAFAGASTQQDQRDIDRIAAATRCGWLRRRLVAPSRPRLGGGPAAIRTVGRVLPRFSPTGEPAMKLHSTLKPKLAALTVASVLALGVVQPAHALFGVGDIVLDPTNLVQNTLTAVRTLEQINNQVQQLQHEAQMLINQARNLTSLPFNVVNRLRSTLATTERLIAEAQGLAYDVANIDREFARLYRSSMPPPSAAIRCTRTRVRAGRTHSTACTPRFGCRRRCRRTWPRTKAC